MTVFEWDARNYDALPLPHVEWGTGVVRRLDPQPGELLLDLGCGTGRDVEHLLALRTGVEVVGVDASRQMLAEFDQRFIGRDGVRSVHADLTGDPLTPARLGLPRRVDGVFSVACFHWISDHAALFRNIAGVLRPGGRLVAECGGAGNVARVAAAIAAAKGTDPDHWAFEDADATRQQLGAAGFVVDDVRLRPDPLVLIDRTPLESYLATVVLGKDLAELPIEDHRGYVSAVADGVSDGTVDYVRLEFEAHLPG
jgi:trans-aconitate 2-methyltransferase